MLVGQFVNARGSLSHYQRWREIGLDPSEGFYAWEVGRDGIRMRWTQKEAITAVPVQTAHLADHTDGGPPRRCRKNQLRSTFSLMTKWLTPRFSIIRRKRNRYELFCQPEDQIT